MLRPRAATTLLALLVLSALVPAAAAQVPGAHDVRLEADSWSQPVQPLAEHVSVPVVAVVACPFPAYPPGAVGRVTFAVVDAPAWAQVVITPAEAAVDYATCADGEARVEATATASVDQNAPAFQPAGVTLAATAVDPHGETVTAETTVALGAGYFSIVDASGANLTRVAAPGERVTFRVTFTNHGNGVTRIGFDLDAPPGVRAVEPMPIVLEAKQQGGAQNANDVNILVEAPNATGPFQLTLRYNATYALDPPLPGDGGAITMLVQVQGGPLAATNADDASGLPIPAAPPTSLLVLVGALALLRPRPRRLA